VLPSGERKTNAHTISLPSLRQHYLFAMSTSLAKSEKQGPDLSSAPKAFSYGKKIAKIGPVYPEIFDEIR